MLRPDIDIAILGGGCAGLSVAARLARSGRSLIVIEPRARYSDDRAWSFWRTAPDPFEDCVQASWSSWSVSSAKGVVVRQSERMQYQSVRAGAFYNRAQSMIADNPAAELFLGRSALCVRKTAKGWLVDTETGAFTANHVIDTRTPQRVPTYGQYFLGWEIRTERPVFNPDRVQLMHFRPARSQGVDFVYTLPFARDRALVEVTSFAPTTLAPDVFKTWLETEIASLEPGGFEVIRQEAGALPMEVGYRESPVPGIIALGLGGGAARPSTGYAFARIQAQADLVVEALARGSLPKPQLDGHVTRFMDRVFLQVLQTMPERGPALFDCLFKNAPADRLERFLSGSVHPVDRLSVMAALPTLPFLQAALVPA